MYKKTLAPILTSLILISGCNERQQTPFKIDYEKYQLDNGLTVILHEDKSDPIVGVAIQYHVGSNREIPGRTGFAHLFEHMLFQESQHVGQDQFFKLIQNAGGTLNGGTSKDGTVYYEVIPKNALETALWLESDRMGWLLSTVTQAAFENQQEVVQNEKRRVQNSLILVLLKNTAFRHCLVKNTHVCICSVGFSKRCVFSTKSKVISY